MRLVIKLPVDARGKFKLQSRGNIPARQYKRGAGVLEALESLSSRTGLKEKIEIVVKEHSHGSFENINETFPLNDREYLLYYTACFLEDYISENTLRKAEKRWTKFLSLGRGRK